MEAKINIDRIGDDLVAAFNSGYQQGLSDARAERKTGKWVEITRYGLNSQKAICECSLCKNNAWVYDDARRRFKFCPNCGARLLSYDV